MLLFTAFFAPSIICQETSFLCNKGPRLFFNTAASKTYRNTGSGELIHYDGADFKGFQAKETISIGSYILTEQSFLDATDINPTHGYFAMYIDYDSVLGLAPHFLPTLIGPLQHIARPSRGLESPFGSLIRNGYLKRPMFSLTFPKPPRVDFSHRSGGSLLLGEEDPKYAHSQFTTIPIRSDSRIDGIWRTEAHSYSWNNSQTLPLPAASTIVFATNQPHIVLPGDWGQRIIRSFKERTIPCNKRAVLPSLELTVAGVLLIIDGYDYTMERSEDPNEETDCQLVLSNMPFFPGEIMLGSSFFEKYHSIFDLENLEIKSKSINYI
jgi:aspartyl protease